MSDPIMDLEIQTFWRRGRTEKELKEMFVSWGKEKKETKHYGTYQTCSTVVRRALILKILQAGQSLLLTRDPK